MVITWKIKQCEYIASTGFIKVVHWKCTAKDKEHETLAYGSVEFNESYPQIPYNEVTENDIFTWIWNESVDKDEIENHLIKEIENEKAEKQKFDFGLPWEHNDPKSSYYKYTKDK